MLPYARRIAAIGLLLIGAAVAQSQDKVTQASGVTGGLVVQIGCGNGDLLAALAANPRFLIQGSRAWSPTPRRFAKPRRNCWRRISTAG